jgi:CHAD domain-containing protein
MAACAGRVTFAGGMTGPQASPLLSRSAAAATASIVRGRVDAALAAAGRLPDAGDADALHDFRVAVRRLRSALRAYRPWLGRAASRKVRRALRDLGRATNVGRDAEVQAEWLASNGHSLSPQARAGVAKLAQRLRKHRSLPVEQLQAELVAIADKILKRLKLPDHAGGDFKIVYAALLAEHTAAVNARLAEISTPDQVEEAHEARIAVKRLRYLLEPLAGELVGAPPLLESVETLQNLLGELHDSHVLDETLADSDAARRASRATREAVAAGNAKRRAAVFAKLEENWLGGVAVSFFELIQRLVTPG